MFVKLDKGYYGFDEEVYGVELESPEDGRNAWGDIWRYALSNGDTTHYMDAGNFQHGVALAVKKEDVPKECLNAILNVMKKNDEDVQKYFNDNGYPEDDDEDSNYLNAEDFLKDEDSNFSEDDEIEF